MPMRRAVAATRQAISPRLAMRIFLNMPVLSLVIQPALLSRAGLVGMVTRIACAVLAAAALLGRRGEGGGARLQAQFGQQRAGVLRFRVRGREQLVAIEDGVGAG